MLAMCKVKVNEKAFWFVKYNCCSGCSYYLTIKRQNHKKKNTIFLVREIILKRKIGLLKLKDKGEVYINVLNILS